MGSIPIHPYTLFDNQNFSTAPWDELISLFEKGREDWIAILNNVDLQQEIQTTKRIWTPQTLTKRLVEHETNHLCDLK